MRRQGCWLLVPLLLGTSGCGLSAERQARPLDPAAAPYRVVTRDRVAPPAGSHRVVLYLVRNGALVPAPRRILQDPTPANVLKALSGGPSAAERADGLTSGLPLDEEVTVAAQRGATVTVSLPPSPESSNRSDSVLEYGQLVLTLTALPSVTGVLFEQNGQRLQVPRSDGSLSGAPLTRLDYRDLVDPA